MFYVLTLLNGLEVVHKLFLVFKRVYSMFSVRMLITKKVCRNVTYILLLFKSGKRCLAFKYNFKWSYVARYLEIVTGSTMAKV